MAAGIANDAVGHKDRPMSETSGNKLLSIFCHLSIVLGIGFLLAPFIVWLVTRNDKTLVSENAREALNFHISLLIYWLCCLPLMLIGVGIFLAWAIGIGGLILAIIACVKSSEGTVYRYPLTIRLVPA
jgi:uncharacterized protein